MPLRLLFLTILVVQILVCTNAKAATVTAGFEAGFIAEYTNAPHQPERVTTFSTLNISQVVILDNTDDGTFGGSQGNDYSVTAYFLYNNGSIVEFEAAVNWRDTGGGTLYGIGLTVDEAGVNDGSGYVLTAGYKQTYLLATGDYAYTDNENLSGNAATTGLLNALNTYVDEQASEPVGDPSVLTTTITASLTTIEADGSSTSVITVQLIDINGKNLTTSDGVVTLTTTAGTFSNGQTTITATNNGDGTYSATLTSSTNTETATITGTLDGASLSDDVSINFVADPPALISGPSGAAGDATSAISVNENQTAVTQVSANEAVTWSISGGADAALFSIDATGIITFNTAPDYENPSDANADNEYVIIVSATDSGGNVSTQTITITVVDVGEVQARLDSIKTDIQNAIREYSYSDLRKSISFNEDLTSIDQIDCNPQVDELMPIVSENDLNVYYTNIKKRDCKDFTRVKWLIKASTSKTDDDWVKRFESGVLVERDITHNFTAGLSATFATSYDNQLPTFSDSGINEDSFMLGFNAKYFIDEKKWFTAFISSGKANYNFDLVDGSLDVDGEVDLTRTIYGLSGVFEGSILELPSSIKIHYSRGQDVFDEFLVNADLNTDTINNVSWTLDSSDFERLSIPITLRILNKNL